MMMCKRQDPASNSGAKRGGPVRQHWIRYGLYGYEASSLWQVCGCHGNIAEALQQPWLDEAFGDVGSASEETKKAGVTCLEGTWISGEETSHLQP